MMKCYQTSPYNQIKQKLINLHKNLKTKSLRLLAHCPPIDHLRSNLKYPNLGKLTDHLRSFLKYPNLGKLIAHLRSFLLFF